MDKTDATQAPLGPIENSATLPSNEQGVPAAERPAHGSGSQSRVRPFLFVILGAAILLRIVTSLGGKPDAGAGLVHWSALAAAPSAASRSGKPVLYDFTAAWCVPCHHLDEEGWADPQIAARVDRDFIAARVVDRQREDGANTPVSAELQRRFSIDAFPTLVVADGSGREIARMEGFPGKEKLVEFLSEAVRKAK